MNDLPIISTLDSICKQNVGIYKFFTLYCVYQLFVISIRDLLNLSSAIKKMSEKRKSKYVNVVKV